MKVDRDRFMDQGYLILRDVVPAGKLRAMRAALRDRPGTTEGRMGSGPKAQRPSGRNV